MYPRHENPRRMPNMIKNPTQNRKLPKCCLLFLLLLTVLGVFKSATHTRCLLEALKQHLAEIDRLKLKVVVDERITFEYQVEKVRNAAFLALQEFAAAQQREIANETEVVKEDFSGMKEQRRQRKRLKRPYLA